MNLVGVALAAEALEVSPRRVRQLLASGQLPGQLLGRSWVIDHDDVDRLRRQGVGRPWNASSAWAVLSLAGGGVADLSPLDRSRARQRIADKGLGGLLAQIQARAEHRDVYAHPSVLDRVVNDVRVVRGGVSASGEHAIDLIVPDAAEVYVRASQIADLEGDYALDGDAERPNLIVRVVDDELWPFEEGERVAPWPVVAVDLLEAGDERSRRAGLELIARHQ